MRFLDYPSISIDSNAVFVIAMGLTMLKQYRSISQLKHDVSNTITFDIYFSSFESNH